nr:pullulanase-type alpha-1,6-glucosidase [Parvularcula maris]
MQDVDGDGIYTFSTKDIPAGSYEVKAALNEGWDESYGAGGGGANLPFTVPSDGALVVFSFDTSTNELTVGGELPKGDLSLAQAYWLSDDVIAWDVPGDAVVSIHHADEGGLGLSASGVTGGEAIELVRVGSVGGEEAEKFRHLSGLPAFRLPAGDRTLIDDILRGQFVLSAVDASGEPLDATAIQAPGVLDDLYGNDEALGVSFDGGAPTLRVWAPTAHNVRLHLFDGPTGGTAQVIDMERDDATGNWSAEGSAGWEGRYYLYEVEVFARSTGRVETNLVTDPYSVSLSMDSLRSQILDLSDPATKPAGWDGMRKARLRSPEDISVYELHVRDFSISDESVPEAERGTFEAFANLSSTGMKHLRSLSRAGLSHVHLLPAFDCATIPEDRSTHKTPGDLSGFASDSTAQQEAIDAIRDEDGFNWCYDPYHYTVPEGSYTAEPDGAARVKAFREMVAGLDRVGLRVVMDVVYNHTSGSGQGSTSVLDRIVPDYYHRLNGDGFIETSSCCANTATEHDMMEKLMVDSLETWAKEYKVDGFRFDLMGHHTRGNILKAKERLQSLTMAEDGVHGPAIYLYGEGWNFGEVANDARFTQAAQNNMGEGTGVGTFNDRLRDAVRGGGPFDQGADHVRRQGFANGLYTAPNFLRSGSEDERRELLFFTDWVRLGLAGSLEDYSFETSDGQVKTGAEIDYFGSPGAGYTSDPQEIINYVAAHDNETLFDINAYKLPRDVSQEDRVRAQIVATSTVLLAQGIPFIHAGQEILRSKSMDRNSYNSGDWFNHLGLDGTDNGWGRGLPPRGDNEANWDEQGALLRNPELAMPKELIALSQAMTEEFLAIRSQHRLFRLTTGEQVKANLHFYNTGPEQIPGLVVMGLGPDRDAPEIVVLFNADDQAVSFEMPGHFRLHPRQKASADPVTRLADHDRQSFAVPARTTSVFLANGKSGRRVGRR